MNITGTLSNILEEHTITKKARSTFIPLLDIILLLNFWNHRFTNGCHIDSVRNTDHHDIIYYLVYFFISLRFADAVITGMFTEET